VHENRLGKTSTHEFDHTKARRRHWASAGEAGAPATGSATAKSLATPAKRSRRSSER
jgi:hypothetical protein